MRIAAASGALLYILMYPASLPLENNPVLDDHLLARSPWWCWPLTFAGDTWSLGKQVGTDPPQPLVPGLR